MEHMVWCSQCKALHSAEGGHYPRDSMIFHKPYPNWKFDPGCSCEHCVDYQKQLPKYEGQTGAVAGHWLDKTHPKLRDYTSAERKAMPVQKGVLAYFPDAIAAVARVSFKGNEKHNPGEPLHWSREKSSDHGDCAVRHMLTPDAIDPDSGEQERAHAAWRILADLQLAEEKRLVAAGIKPLSGVTT